MSQICIWKFIVAKIMGQAQINVRTRACSRTSIARTRQAALTHNVRGKELTVEYLLSTTLLYPAVQCYHCYASRHIISQISSTCTKTISSKVPVHWSDWKLSRGLTWPKIGFIDPHTHPSRRYCWFQWISRVLYRSISKLVCIFLPFMNILFRFMRATISA